VQEEVDPLLETSPVTDAEREVSWDFGFSWQQVWRWLFSGILCCVLMMEVGSSS
jgi:hypothetical protein